MEEDLLKIFKLLNKLNDEQNRFYASIIYSPYKLKTIEISIRDKKDFSFISVYKIELFKSSEKELENVIQLLESYTGGTENE